MFINGYYKLRNIKICEFSGITNMCKIAFTLAEVIIVIGIIGIIAETTIPALVENYQKQVTVTKLKQTYSIISQAVILSEADNGEISTWNIPSASFDSTAYSYGKIFAEQYLTPYLKILKRCKINSMDCWAKNSYLPNKIVNNYFSAASNETYSFILENGVVLGIWPRGNVVEIYVDLNGPSKPNVLGKEEFNIVIIQNSSNSQFGIVNKSGVYLYGQGHDKDYLTGTQYLSCNNKIASTNAGTDCGALIQYDGWRIADDYPW